MAWEKGIKRDSRIIGILVLVSIMVVTILIVLGWRHHEAVVAAEALHAVELTAAYSKLRDPAQAERWDYFLQDLLAHPVPHIEPAVIEFISGNMLVDPASGQQECDFAKIRLRALWVLGRIDQRDGVALLIDLAKREPILQAIPKVSAPQCGYGWEDHPGGYLDYVQSVAIRALSGSNRREAKRTLEELWDRYVSDVGENGIFSDNSFPAAALRDVFVFHNTSQ